LGNLNDDDDDEEEEEEDITDLGKVLQGSRKF
jgi:hypothetical protein